jgi:3-hydroxyisobutyrate dehydrogenase-like beta-hydroxyacid dehydrogenase
MDVAFLGLGKMGRVMARNLLRAGYPLRVWNRSSEAVAELSAEGAHALPSAAAAFDADVVISMLADDPAVRSVVLGAAPAQARAGLIHVSMSTLSVALVRELDAHHRAAGQGFVAAPVFGRPDAAAAAKLHVLTAGRPAAVATVTPLLQVLGQRLWPLGEDPVQAAVAKIAGNFMLASAIEAMAEASALVESHGLPGARLLEMLSQSLFAAPVYQGYGALIAESRYEPAGFPARLGLKDVRLALSAAEEKVLALPLGSLLRDHLLEAIAHGHGEKDWACLGAVARARAGEK